MLSSSPTPSSLHPHASNPGSRSATPLPPQGPSNDHALSFRHRLSQREYPPDCPPLNVRWYYAVDVPKRKPFQSLCGQPAKPSKPPAKFVNFGLCDSRTIEAAFQKLSEEEEVEESTKYKRASAIDLFTEGDIGQHGKSLEKAEKGVMVPVNEDFLFDVDIKKRELMPVYWEGPVYDVRRGTWFYQEGSSIRPCDENLATQIEEGYLNLKPFRGFQQDGKGTKAVTLDPSTAKKDAEPSRPSSSGGVPATEKPWRLFGAHIGSSVVFTDAQTAWLFTDDLYGKLTAMTWQMVTAGNHPGGVKIVRGYFEQKKSEKTSSRPATPPTGDKPPNILDNRYNRKSAPPPAISEPGEEAYARTSKDSGRMALERKFSAYADNEAQEKLMESEMKEDYGETDDPGRSIEHLILVTHGIGQKLSMKMESVNFVHDVNVFRKSLKGVYGASPDLQVLNGEDNESKRKNCRVQCLPVCWRHLLDFPKQSLRHNRGEQDIATDSNAEEEYPSLEDITVEGAPYVRNLMTDLALDVLLYQSSTYREHIIRTVLTECNRIYAIFKERNPSFNGKVSLVGHSLGSAILFDILCRQPDDRPGVGKQKNELPSLDFPVENFFCLGSPVGLFQMLKGRTIMARSAATTGITPSLDGFSHSPFSTESSPEPPYPVSSPKCGQLFNIFHPADPISYRLEPLVSKAMAQLKPQPLPYTKRGLFSSNGQIVGGISGIGQSVTKSVSNMWSSFSSGIASSILNRSLGITDSTSLSSATSASDVNKVFIPTEGQHPPTMIDAEIETLYAGFQKKQKEAEGRDQGEIEKDERRVKREDDKVRALNDTGRIDFSIQEGVFDLSVIASIASHLSYWGDDDVNHFIVSQLLSRSRVMKKKTKDAKCKGKDLGGGWVIGEVR